MITQTPAKYGVCHHLDPDSQTYNVTYGTMDIVTAAAWALSRIDPALQHFAELREHYRDYTPEQFDLKNSLDRALAVYLEAQCVQLTDASGLGKRTIDEAILNTCGAEQVSTVTYQALILTDDPLILEILSYAMHLATLTSWGATPFNRLAKVVEEAYNTRKEPART